MGFELVVGLGGLAFLVLLIAIRVPIAYAMILVGGIGVSMLNGTAIFMSQLKDLAYIQFSIYDLSVIPMFVLMGNIASRSGLSQELFRAANAWIGWARGGVAMSAILACAGFGAVCGSSLATASTMGQVALPELKKYRYKSSLATGTLAAGGVLGILIPPSVVLVIYAILVEANIVTMFMAAFVPGILAVILFLLTIFIYVRVFPNSGPARDAIGQKEFWSATFGVLPVILIFGAVIGGIYFGIFNPTPAAAVGVFLVAAYALALRRVDRVGLKNALFDTAKTTGMIYLILLGAEMLKIFMSRGGVPQAAAEAMLNSGLEPMMIMVLLLLALIALGCLMDSLSMILLAIPFFWPVISELDFGMSVEDLKIWFGILALIVVELGLITPPVGMNVFIISAMAKDVPMRETFAGVMPFFASEIVRIILLLAFPGIVLWLPSVLSG
ncbi:MAG: TRAP transporter large permease [Litorivicinaceae bacterium]|jgi:tripartite ATP-independent transporter DctM subunit|nr:TRAP transporter large permease [Litorivicinaceae bacterium]MDP5329093.1 TRAP transporter large permease [Litorivicinaceae bacterium]MDP5341197.1 TRAP transporter large permease [Litorivicinaceae bacterium]MDP5342393.1 TRAP transporter large permease [Litorivicinaceae bacterium]MDP5343729.1 TRAP transporter large permease [Litorivicinaceae bacterium]